MAKTTTTQTETAEAKLARQSAVCPIESEKKLSIIRSFVTLSPEQFGVSRKAGTAYQNIIRFNLSDGSDGYTRTKEPAGSITPLPQRFWVMTKEDPENTVVFDGDTFIYLGTTY